MLARWLAPLVTCTEAHARHASRRISRQRKATISLIQFSATTALDVMIYLSQEFKLFTINELNVDSCVKVS